MALILERPITDKDVQNAIETIISECFPAMSIANALAGSPSTKWDLIRKYSLIDLVQEAIDRGLPVKEFKSGVGQVPFMETKISDEIKKMVSDWEVRKY